MKRWTICAGLTAGLSFVLITQPALSQKKAEPVKSLRLYVFDRGTIRGLDPALFQFKKEDLKDTNMVVPCYLVAHPKGTLMWDVGVIPDSAFKDDAPASQPLLIWAGPALRSGPQQPARSDLRSEREISRKMDQPRAAPGSLLREERECAV